MFIKEDINIKTQMKKKSMSLSSTFFNMNSVLIYILILVQIKR